MSQPEQMKTQDMHASIKELFEQFLLALVLAFVARAFLVEPFIIPTGSMAPTLLGQHYHNTCPQCGYQFDVGPDSQLVNCSMCRFNIKLPRKRINSEGDSGDRILVLKYIHTLAEPKRFDPIVFKNPNDPTVNFIKRLIGLPGETIRLVGGNVYISPAGLEGDKPKYAIARKPAGVQSVLWQPVYHSMYYPIDHGDPDLSKDRFAEWELPWKVSGEDGGEWDKQKRGRLTPRVFGFTGKGEEASGRVRFDFEHYHDGKNIYAYNQLNSSRSHTEHYGDNAFEDMRLGVTVVPTAGQAGVVLTISTLTHFIRAAISKSGELELMTAERDKVVYRDRARFGRERRKERREDVERYLADGTSWKQRVAKKVSVNEKGLPYRFELIHYDQAISVNIDGEPVVDYAYPDEQGSEDLMYDLDARAAFEKAVMYDNKEPGVPWIEIGVAGKGLKLRDVNLDRDIYYLQTSRGKRFGTADNPAKLNADEFYCLGDNSPESDDSRSWKQVDPWVQYYYGQDVEIRRGVVPRELIIGRAFYVYWPAAFGKDSRIGLPVLPNFSRMRLIR